MSPKSDRLNLEVFPDDLDLGESWNCAECGEAWLLKRNPRPEHGACPWCVKRRRDETPPPDASILSSSAVPMRFRQHLSREQWEANFDKKWGIDFDPAAGNQLILSGDTGTGKSTAAAILLLEFGRKRKKCIWTSSVEALYRLRDIDRQGPDLMDRLMQCDLLVWDDLFAGRQRPTDWAVETTLLILGTRYDECRATITTSVLKFQDILMINPSLCSRLMSGKVKGLMGKDNRLARVKP